MDSSARLLHGLRQNINSISEEKWYSEPEVITQIGNLIKPLDLSGDKITSISKGAENIQTILDETVRKDLKLFLDDVSIIKNEIEEEKVVIDELSVKIGELEKIVNDPSSINLFNELRDNLKNSSV